MAQEDQGSLQERTRNFGVEAIQLYRNLPDQPDAIFIGNKFLENALTVGATTASAFNSKSKDQYRSKLESIIEKSEYCIFYLNMMADSGVLTEPDIEECVEECTQYLSIFAALVKRTRQPMQQHQN